MKTKKGEKEKLRQLILDMAVSFFKLHGRTGSATEALMEKAGLTKGALYSHFESKDDLFIQSVCHDLHLLQFKIESCIQSHGARALPLMIESHLSEETLDSIGESCVLSSLSSDMNRCSPDDRKKFAALMDALYQQFADALKFHFPNSTNTKRLEMAQVLYASLVGAVSTARLQVDRKSAVNVLKTNRKALLKAFCAGR